MRPVPILALAFATLLAAPAQAKETAAVTKANALLAEAEKARKAKAWDKAAQSIAEAVVLAQSEKDLGLESRGAEAFEELFDDVPDQPAPAGGTTATVGRGEVLALVMRALDPVRHGAYVSAHVLATELVLRAVERGDAAHLDAAESVLVAFSATPKSGKGAAAMTKLAQGVKAARAGDAKSTRASLEPALALVKQGRWLRPTLAAHLEWMLLQLTAGDPAAAATTLQDAVGYLAPKSDIAQANAWIAAARARLAAAPADVRGAFDRAVEPYAGAGAPGADGGRGGHGGGPNSVSPLGKAWSKLPADKPFATVKRGEAGYDLRTTYDKKFAFTQPYKAGQNTWDLDGLTLVFADGGVALRMLDMAGTETQPGGRAEASPAWGWYLLAPGETYGVTKAGLVAIG